MSGTSFVGVMSCILCLHTFHNSFDRTGCHYRCIVWIGSQDGCALSHERVSITSLAPCAISTRWRQLPNSTNGLSIVSLPWNVNSIAFRSVRDFCDNLMEWKVGKPIDRLICNAGVYQPSLPYAKWSVDDHEQTMQINYLSHFLMIR